MKQIINKLSVYLFAFLFASGGYFIGSSRQKVFISLPLDETSGVSVKKVNPLPLAPEKNAVSAPIPPVPAPQASKAAANSNVKTTAKPAPVAAVKSQPAPEPTPAPAPAPVPAPEPVTKVS